MYKKLRDSSGLFLFTLFLMLHVVSIPARAVSPSIVISELQTGGTGSNASSQEFIELYNNSAQAVNVSGWKVVYASASDSTQKVLATFAGQLESHGFLLLATNSFTTTTNVTIDTEFTAGLASTGGHIKVYDSGNVLIDKLGWGSAVGAETKAVAAPASESSVQRIVNEDGSMQDSDNNFLDFILSDNPEPRGGWLSVIEEPESPIEYLEVQITELLPNPTSPKLDETDEFIELFNPNTEFVNLENYELQIGSSFQYSFTLPSISIEAGEYIVLYSSETNLPLSNTSSRARLLTPDNTIVSETTAYNDVKEAESWALLGNDWTVTNQPTPAAANRKSIVVTASPNGNNTTSLKPCRADQFRNPLTNRCKKKETATTALASCGPGKFRNPETNRCKSVVSASVSLKPCSPGQARNPATNRCKKIGSEGSTLKPCSVGQERNPETNRCRKVAGTLTTNPLSSPASTTASSKVSLPTLAVVGTLAGAYGLFEYRSEIGNQWAKIRKKR